MRRITPRTCLWPLTGCLCATFALSVGLTYRSDHHCYAATCGEWLFPLQARLHVVVWYLWITLSIGMLSLRTFWPSVRALLQHPLSRQVPWLGKRVRISGLLLFFWILSLYGIAIGVWWTGLRDYFARRGDGLPGNNVVAAIAMTGHLADVTMGMVLLPVSRHSALASFFKLSPSTTFTFHMLMAYLLFGLIMIHGCLYADWAALYDQNRDGFRHVLPVLNPTYLFDEVWPGNKGSLGTWRASLIFTGLVSAAIMVAMFFTSFPAVRRKHFNVFYFTHLLGIIAVIVICLHASTMFYCIIPGLSMWLLDWGMRIFELRGKLDSHLKALGNGWYCITLPLPRKRLSGCACHSPLAHFYIYHSESSTREIHPFTTVTHLASKKRFVQDGEESINIQFLFRQSDVSKPLQLPLQPPSKTSTQWTNKLASLAETGESGLSLLKVEGCEPDIESSESDKTPTSLGVKTWMRLEGPYFTPAIPASYKIVVCFVAGTGLSGAIAIAAAFCATREKPRYQTPSLHKVETEAVHDGHWQRCVVIWSVRECDYTDMPFFKSLQREGLEFRIHKTGGRRPRLDVSETLKDICGTDGADSWSYIAGPNGFIDSAEHACSQVKGLTWFPARWD